MGELYSILKRFKKRSTLESYKLDNVSAHFMKGKSLDKGLFKISDKEYITIIYTNTLGNLKKGDYITLNLITKYGTIRYNDGEKFKIKGLNTERKIQTILNHLDCMVK